jgi:hypothetical protein
VIAREKSMGASAATLSRETLSDSQQVLDDVTQEGKARKERIESSRLGPWYNSSTVQTAERVEVGLQEQKLVDQAYQLRMMPDGPEKSKMKADLIRRAKKLERKSGSRAHPSYAPVRTLYGPGGEMAPRRAEVLVPLSVLKDKESAMRSGKGRHADKSADTYPGRLPFHVYGSMRASAPGGILDLPWYNYLNPQAGFGDDWERTYMAQRHFEAMHEQMLRTHQVYAPWGRPGPYPYAAGAIDKNQDGVIEPSELADAAAEGKLAPGYAGGYPGYPGHPYGPYGSYGGYGW